MLRKVPLSSHESLLVQIAHSDHRIAVDAAERALQQRLQAITDPYDIPEDTEISFVKEGERITLSFEAPDRSLRLEKPEAHADATVYAEEDGS